MPCKSIFIAMPVLAGCMLIGASAMSARDGENTIKVGTADVSVKFNASATAAVPPELEVRLIVPHLFDPAFDNATYDLKNDGNNNFTISVPLDTKHSLAGMIVRDPGQPMALSMGYIELDQNRPLEITGTLVTPDSIAYSFSDPEGFNSLSMGREGNATQAIEYMFMNFCNFMFTDGAKDAPLPTPDDYRRNIVKDKLPGLYSYMTEFSRRGTPAPDFAEPWIDNCMRYNFAGQWVLPYQRQAERLGCTDSLPMPPLDYYRLLDEIDYSDLLLSRPTTIGVYPFLKNMTKFLPVGIQPIGESSVGQWRKDAGERLGRVIDNPTGLLLNLLSATSYVMQIEDDNMPLTASQIANVKSGYPDNDLDKLILMKNETLVNQLKQGVTIYDYSDPTTFDIDSFITEKFAGKPVVVDFWNTWCGPCMNAHSEVSHIKGQPVCGDVEFLYISDSSSNPDEFARHAPKIGGHHVRLGEQAAKALYQKIGLEAFPTYLFLDRNHKLINRSVAFPGLDEYVNLLSAIKN